MISTQDLRIDEYFANPVMPFGMRITHVPSGIMVDGNCRVEQSKGNLHATLMHALNQMVADEIQPQATNGKNDYLREQLLQMQAQLNSLLNASQDVITSPVAPPAPKRGHPKATAGAGRGHHTVSPEVRQQLSESMKARHAAKKAQSDEEARLLAQQMRPPSDPPMELGKSHQSHGSVVAKSNVPWIKP
jgi:hypothetical protein